MSRPGDAETPPEWPSPRRPDEKNRRERRQIETQGTGIALRTLLHRVHLGLPVVGRSTETRVVRIEYFSIGSGLRDPDGIPIAGHRRRVEHAGDGGAGVLADAAARKRPDALVGVVQIHPAESFVIAI